MGVPPPLHYRERRAGGAVDEIGGELGSWKGNWRWNLYLVHWSWSWLGLELTGAGVDMDGLCFRMDLDLLEDGGFWS